MFPAEPIGVALRTTRVFASSLTTTVPDVPQHMLNVTLRCAEWVRYTVGTDTRTDTATVFERTFRVEGTIQDNTFKGAFNLEIPVDRGGPTLELSDNKVNWTLEIELAPISTVSGDHDLDLTVSTALDRRHQRLTDSPPPPRPFDA